MKRPLLYAVLLIALFGAVFASVTLAGRHRKTTVSDGTITYRDPVSTLTFRYPVAYGDVQVQDYSTADATGPVSAGQAKAFRFTANKNVSLILASADFRALGVDAYTGTPPVSSGCAQDVPGIETLACRTDAIGRYTWVGRLTNIADEGVYNVANTYASEMADGAGPYRGIEVIQSFPSVYADLNQNLTPQERSRIRDEAVAAIRDRSNTTIRDQVDAAQTLIGTISFDDK